MARALRDSLPCTDTHRAGWATGSTSTSGEQRKSGTIFSRAPDGRDSPLVQQFEDVPPSHTFYSFINALYLDDVVTGYACGGPGEPCGVGNLPYYRPGNDVNRGQMAKFVDNGRRNISHAVGLSLQLTDTIAPALTISSTAYDSIDIYNASGNQGIDAHCSRANLGCISVYGWASEGNRPGWFLGGQGTVMGSNDDGYAATVSRAYGNNSYAIDAQSDDYRGGTVRTNSTSYYSFIVDTPPTGTASGIYGRVEASLSVGGDLWVSGSKAGYVIDVMQNAGSEPLQSGDVVVIVGNAPAVMGQIPVVRVAKAGEEYNTGVVGIVDQAVYVPDDGHEGGLPASKSRSVKTPSTGVPKQKAPP